MKTRSQTRLLNAVEHGASKKQKATQLGDMPPSSTIPAQSIRNTHRHRSSYSTRGSRTSLPRGAKQTPHSGVNVSSGQTTRQTHRHPIRVVRVEGPLIIDPLPQDKEGMEVEILSLTRSRDRALENLEETKKLLEARTAELQASLAFFGPVSNTVTESQVKVLVEDLNHEILQVSSVIADSLNRKGRYPRSFTSRLPFRGQNSLMDDLYWSADEDVAFRVQIALQNCMASLCMRVINTLSGPGMQEVTSLTKRVSQSVTFPVFSRWRAITHLHGVQPQQLSNTSLDILIELTEDILKTAGFPSDYSKLATQLGRVTSMATALNVTLKQKLLSTNAAVFYFPPGEEFDPEAMQVDYLPRQGQSFSQPLEVREKILCTTRIGLDFLDDRTGEVVVALKASVALRSILGDDHLAI